MLPLLPDRHIAAPVRIRKVPEASGLFRGVAALGVIAVRGAAFHEVDPIAGGRPVPIQARGMPAQPTPV